MGKKTDETGLKQEKKIPSKKPGVFQKGDPRINRKGRTPGAESFRTQWFKAVKKIAKQNKISIDSVETQLFLMGYKKALSGEYKFYQDIMDRVYGKPKQSLELSGGLDNSTDVVLRREQAQKRAKEMAEKWIKKKK